MDLFVDKISDDIIYNKNLVKIFDGIAGSGKTTYLSNKFEEDKVPYIHLTSTNRLKRDIEKRFPNRIVKTVASGLFKTENQRFYSQESDLAIKTIIIDEILQTHPNVIKWINTHKGEYNIFICTDRKQMLSPEQTEYMSKSYDKLLQDDSTYLITPTITHRPRTQETRDFYYKSYTESLNDSHKLYHKLKKNFDTISYKNLPDNFTEKDAFITHTNDIEKDIYARYLLQERYDLELIPKGTISAKEPKDKRKYPILPQGKAQNTPFLGYWQVGNVGTVIRYQGSEIDQNAKLYYLVDKHGSPSDREIYTMITRMKDISSLVIVECPDHVETSKIVSFDNIPIYEEKTDIVKRDEVYKVDEKGKVDYNGKVEKKVVDNEITKDIFMQLLARHNRETEDGKVITGLIINGHKYDKKSFTKQDVKKTKISLTSLLKKDPDLKCESMDEILRIIDSTGVGYPKQPLENKMNTRKDGMHYGIDLYSSYPTALKYGYIPDGTSFTEDMSQECKMGIYIDDGYYKKGVVVMTPLYEYLIAEKGDRKVIKDIGSFKRMEHTYTGDKFYELVYKSKEDKAESKKGGKWGILERRYLEKTKKNDKDIYIRKEKNVYEVLMYAIRSYQCFTIEQIRDIIYGSHIRLTRGSQHVDCLYFNTDKNIETIGTWISMLIKGDFRISEITQENGKFSENKVLYKSYEDLKTRDEIKKEKKKILNAKRYKKQGD